MPERLAEYFGVFLGSSMDNPKGCTDEMAQCVPPGPGVTWGWVLEQGHWPWSWRGPRGDAEVQHYKSGMRILVLMDGVLVFGNDRAEVDRWETRLRRSLRSCDIVVKAQRNERGDSLQTIAEHCPCFAVVVLGAGWRAETLAVIPAEITTVRQLSSVPGVLLWQVRVNRTK
jgi:hypothetical protein